MNKVIIRFFIVIVAISGAAAVITGLVGSDFLYKRTSYPLAAVITPSEEELPPSSPAVPTPQYEPPDSQAPLPPSPPPPSTPASPEPPRYESPNPPVLPPPVAPTPSLDGVRFGTDGRGHFVMQSKPRFILGVYDSGLGYSNSASFYEENIFDARGRRGLSGVPINMYLNYHYGSAPIKAMNALMDVLQNHGVMYLQTANCFAKGSYTRISFGSNEDEYVRSFAEHPAAAGYYIMDECEESLIPETREHAERLRRLDPNSMSLAVIFPHSERDPAKWLNTADILAYDVYPLYDAEPAAGYSHFKVADHIARLRKIVPKDHPIMAVLQLFKFTSNGRLPTYEEMKAHAVMSIVEGAQGIFWWEIGANGLRKSPAADVAYGMANLRRLVRELADIESALIAESAPWLLVKNSTASDNLTAFRIAALKHNIEVNPLWSDKRAYQAEIAALERGDTSKSFLLDQGATIRTLAKIAGGKEYLFAYNYTNKPVSATFTWHKSPDVIAVQGEDRTVQHSNSSFSDSFGPYQAHVYVIQ